MASVSSGARRSCEDHLQLPGSGSAACLKSLALMQFRNGNGSKYSVLHSPHRFLSPLCQRKGVCLLGTSALSPFFCLTLSSTLYASLLLLLFPAFPSLASPLVPKLLFPTLRREEQNLWRVCFYLLPQSFFSIFYCNLFPSVWRQQRKPGHGTSAVMMKWKTVQATGGQTWDNVNKTDTIIICGGSFIFLLFKRLLSHEAITHDLTGRIHPMLCGLR